MTDEERACPDGRDDCSVCAIEELSNENARLWAENEALRAERKGIEQVEEWCEALPDYRAVYLTVGGVHNQTFAEALARALESISR